ncbi:MAG: hypothetical protein WC028_28845 [Candidatus Obscuribacterales bacterium]
MTNRNTETTSTDTAAKPELVMYLQGPYERFPSCVHKVDGKPVATFRWERGWVYADAARAANIFQRALAVMLLKAGDIVRGWTKDGWQFGTYVQGSAQGNSKGHIFRTADGTTYFTEVAEPHAFERGEGVMAKINGEWLPCLYQKYQDGQYFVNLASASGSEPNEWQVSHLAFRPDSRPPITRS